jgi:hypothetical protein
MRLADRLKAALTRACSENQPNADRLARSTSDLYRIVSQ